MAYDAAVARSELDVFITNVEDSRRWQHIAIRPDDIIISTPPKSGTTWTQQIVHSLLWPSGDAPGTRGDLARWVDMRLRPIDELVEHLESQEHRRSIKTHSPATCTPFDPGCSYIVVYRDGRDALLSWGNHRRHMRSDVMAEMNEQAAADGLAPLDLQFDGDYDKLYQEWLWICSPIEHLRSWWPRSTADNVLFVHYAELTADLGGEMRRIADFLGLRVADDRWAAVVDSCTLEAMRAGSVGMERVFDGGAQSFFHKGGSGRWRGVLPQDILDDYRHRVDNELPSAAARWLEHGSLALGHRPADIGAAR